MNTPSTTATRQFAGLVLAPVEPAKLESLRRLLADVGEQTIASMRGRPPSNPIVPFHLLDTVHYARFVLLDQGDGRSSLAFGTDYDGPEGETECTEARAWQHHKDDLVRHASEGLERVFGCCEGYRPGALCAYLDRHRRGPSTYYVGSSGRSKHQIAWEANLRRRVDQILDANDFRGVLPEDVRQRVLSALAAANVTLPPFPAQPDLSARVRWYALKLVALAVAGAAALVAGAAVLFHLSLLGGLGVCAAILACGALAVARFLHLERTDPQFQPGYSEREHTHFQTASADENHFLQNQLTHLVSIKPGPLRWVLIRLVFGFLQAVATNVYNKGKLGGIPSIHFARWNLIPNRGVLFFSNFDSSWQSYLGDFIDQASSGLTAVWSNTVGYPRTRWLLEAGSRDASRFLSWARHHQLPTQVWYCAYPGLSIVNINDNTEVRRGLADRASVDATTWLFRLRAIDRLRTDQLFADEQTRDPSLPLADIQGVVLWGYGHMPEARYVLLRVKEARPELLPWLGSLPLNSAAAEAMNDAPPEPLVNVAFTYQGLRALGVDEGACRSFSTAFYQNSNHPYRTRVNGDVGVSAPENWQWGSEQHAVHIALFIYASSKAGVERYAQQYTREAQACGLELVQVLEATTLPGRKEHFGFRDGIAQPTIQGSGRAELAGNTVAAGEFLLGHRDGYGNVTHSPHSPSGFNMGLNGSYVVLRQLEQDVEAFWRYCAAKGEAVTVASKMVGRWPSGAPLLRHPDRDPEDDRFSDDDNFTYIANDEDNDRYGARCPFGSHVRRTNPRDWQLADTREEALHLSNLHRIIRRGRPYGAPLDESVSVPAMLAAATSNGTSSNGHATSSNGHATAGARRGLQFMCFNANIDRQFEFIQQQWCNNPKFAGLSNEPDPLLGLARPAELGLDGLGFTIQTDVKGGISTRCNELQQFVKVVGSSYFFMPSITAVRLLGAGLLASAAAESLESPPADEQLHVDSLIFNLGEKMKRDYVGGKTLRDAHPKMHGCVQARFVVERDLPPALAVGVFAKPKVYSAWVRFSNASGNVSHDHEKDLLGAAIKLMGVPGFKLLEGEEACTTHDFLMVSHDVFITKDVAEFAGLVEAIIAGKAAVARYALTRPRLARNLFASLRRHTSPLEATYFSMVPYLLGSHAVKYSLRPSKPAKTPLPKPASYNYLRERLRERLGKESVSFDFLVQRRTRPERMPIEDAAVAWREAEAPFEKVATLEIQQQVFDTPERQAFGDELSFNPWRCLPEHRPLGGLSRARRQVYRALSALRHGRNAVLAAEPAETAPQRQHAAASTGQAGSIIWPSDMLI